MKRFEVKRGQAAPELIIELTGRLQAGEVGILPTETVYGIVCAWGEDDSVQRLYRMKQRPADKALPLLVKDLSDAKTLGVDIDEAMGRLAARFWPGPLTMVVAAADGTEYGMRAPDHPLPLAVISRLGRPLWSSSANRSGEPPPGNAGDAAAQLSEAPDFVVDEGPLHGRVSTVVRLRSGAVEVLRRGDVSEEAIRESLDAV